MRGGVHAPLSQAELEAKFMDNVVYGGWPAAKGERFRQLPSSSCRNRTWLR
jgi:hypothetical protein